MRAIKANPGERKGCRLQGRGIVVLFVTRICQKIASAQKMYIFPFSQEVPFVRLSFSLEMWPELAFPRKMRVEEIPWPERQTTVVPTVIFLTKHFAFPVCFSKIPTRNFPGRMSDFLCVRENNVFCDPNSVNCTSSTHADSEQKKRNIFHFAITRREKREGEKVINNRMQLTFLPSSTSPTHPPPPPTPFAKEPRIDKVYIVAGSLLLLFPFLS